ncbi:MAG: patatin-like phospholipase family protein [Deltaproteobacteria bacterium]|nr:patatin-like phospholipase family protein [Deltaproteobacteria bacterium]
MAYHFRNLVFEGGGVKGIAYVGALQVLQEKEILRDIVRVGGTSAGAIMAVLLGLGYSLAETSDVLKKLNFREFLDDSRGAIRDVNRLITEFGWYKGDFFRDWIGERIKTKTGNSESTFRDIYTAGKEQGLRELFFIGTNLSTGFAEVFSYEHTPRMCIADAVRISMSIPLFFASRRSPRGDVYVDGGLIDNYPVKLFDRKKYVDTYFKIPPYYEEHNAQLTQDGRQLNPYVYNMETIGFRLDSAKEIAVFRDQAEPEHIGISDLFSYSRALVGAILNIQDSMHLHSDDWQRTIYIDTRGVGTTDFDLDDGKKDELIGSGEKWTKKYFDEWYADPTLTFSNRP